MTVSDKNEKIPKQVINKGDLKALQNIDTINGIIVGGISGGAVYLFLVLLLVLLLD